MRDGRGGQRPDCERSEAGRALASPVQPDPEPPQAAKGHAQKTTLAEKCEENENRL